MQLLTALARDAKHLLEQSYLRTLPKDQAQSLINYLKLIKEIEKEKLKEQQDISTEELEKIAKNG
jgi:hypothetical protein